MTNNTPGAGRRIAGRAALGAVAAPLALLAVAGPASAAGLGFNGAIDDNDESKSADLTVDWVNDGTLDLAGLGGLDSATGLLDAGNVASATDLLGLATGGLGGGLGGGLSVTDDLDAGSAPLDLGVARVNLDNPTERALASLDTPGDVLGLGGVTGGGNLLDAVGGGDVKDSKLEAIAAVDLDASNNKATTRADADTKDADSKDADSKDADSKDADSKDADSKDATDDVDDALTDGTDSVTSTTGGLTGGDIVSSVLGGTGSLGGLF